MASSLRKDISQLSLERLLELNGFEQNVRMLTVDGREYTFQYWNPATSILIEIYQPKAPEQMRGSAQYDQLYFLVELHIKLVHRHYSEIKISEAIAVGDFSDRSKEYAQVHGGMKLLTPSQASDWLANTG
jgi:hypothetical protein